MCVKSPIGTTVLIMHQAHNSEFSLGPLDCKEIIAPPKRSKKGKRTDFTDLIRRGTSGTAAGSSGTLMPSGGPSTHTDSGMATPSNPPPAPPPLTSSSGPLSSTVANTGAATAPVEPGGTAATVLSELSEALQPGAPSTANTGGSRTIDDLFQQLSDIRRELDAKHSAPPEAIFFKSVPKSKPCTFHRQKLLVSSQIIYANPAVSYKPLGLGA